MYHCVSLHSHVSLRVLTLTVYHYVSLHSQNVRSVFVNRTCGHDEESLALTRLTERPVCVRPLNLRTRRRLAVIADAVKTRGRGEGSRSR
jgi:hypothetical protein